MSFMDIFTTQLTRVVPVPIKPAKLKVKALLKDAGAGKLKEDLDHLENHDYYFNQSDESIQALKDEQEHQSTKDDEKNAESSNQIKDDAKKKAEQSSEKANHDEVIEVDGVKHLDLYV